MYAEAVARIATSIFPIFQLRHEDGGLAMEVAGTGFFVDPRGLFVTVERIVTSASAGSTLYYYGNVPDDVCAPVEIECVAADAAQGLYLGRVFREDVAPVELSCEAVRPGDSVCLGGYPMAALATNSEGRMVGNVRRYWQPTFVVDSAAMDSRRCEGFIVQHPCLWGMQGGPAFDTAGRLRGVAAATLTRTIADPGGSPTVLHNGVVIDVEHVRSFIAEHIGARKL